MAVKEKSEIKEVEWQMQFEVKSFIRNSK